jgi:glycosyltransferase involved in cell wall biosynthesis
MSKGTIIYIGGFNFFDTDAATNMVLANARLFEEIGFKVVLIGQDKYLKCGTDIIKTQKNMNGFDIWSIPYPSTTIKRINQLTTTSSYIKVIENYEDVRCVICYNFPAVAFKKIIHYCKKKGICIISNSTEWYGKAGVSLIFDLIKKIDTSYRMRVLNNKVDGLIVCSKYLSNFYKGEPALILPTFSSINVIKTKKKENSVPKIIYGGVPFRLNVRIRDKRTMKDRLDKTIRYLFDVYKEGIKFQFDIYGLSKKEYLIALPEDKLIVEKLGDSIIFHGRISSEELAERIREADFSIFIRDINRVTMAGFPTKFTESVNLGTPVITTKTSDLEEYLIEGENGFFLEMENKLAVEKLKYILKMDSSERNEIKLRCMQYDGLDYHKWISKTEAFFETVLKKKREKI